MADEKNTSIPNRTMPASTIIPVLEYQDVTAAIDWLCKAFDFTERWHAGNHRAQLSYGGGTIVVTQQGGQTKNIQSLLVRVPNVEQHYRQSRQQGASILQEPADFPYGERQYSAEDIHGHIWTFSQSIRDVAPEDWGGTSHQLDQEA